MDYIQIHDPKKPGDYLLLAVRDFIEGVHRLFTEPLEPATGSGPTVADRMQVAQADATRGNALAEPAQTVSEPQTTEEREAFAQDIGRPADDAPEAQGKPKRPRKAKA